MSTRHIESFFNTLSHFLHVQSLRSARETRGVGKMCLCLRAAELNFAQTLKDGHGCNKLRPQMHLSLFLSHSLALTPLSQAFFVCKA